MTTNETSESRRVRVQVGYAVTKDKWSYESTVELAVQDGDFDAEAFAKKLATLQDIARASGEAEVIIRTHHDDLHRKGER